jgi:HK97 gp10 family phage protein
MSAQLEGVNQLLNRINDLGRTVPNQVRDKALDKASQYLKQKLEDNVYSFGLHELTGTAKQSMVVSTIKDGKVDVGIKNTGEAFYLYFHEFGFFNKMVGKKVPARPLFRPTFENEKQRLQQIMKDVIKGELNI